MDKKRPKIDTFTKICLVAIGLLATPFIGFIIWQSIPLPPQLPNSYVIQIGHYNRSHTLLSNQLIKTQTEYKNFISKFESTPELTELNPDIIKTLPTEQEFKEYDYITYFYENYSCAEIVYYPVSVKINRDNYIELTEVVEGGGGACAESLELYLVPIDKNTISEILPIKTKTYSFW